MIEIYLELLKELKSCTLDRYYICFVEVTYSLHIEIQIYTAPFHTSYVKGCLVQFISRQNLLAGQIS